MGRRIDYLDDPEAPAANSLVPSVNVAVTNDACELLLMRRTDNDNWALPGGAMDPGESMADAAIRETKEETGIDCEIVGLVGIYTNPRHVILYTSNGEVRQECSFVFAARAVGGQPTPSSESSEVRWVDPGSALGYEMHASMRQRVEHFLEGRATPYIGDLPGRAGRRASYAAVMDLVPWAMAEGERWLSPLGDRWRHTRAVGQRAEDLAAVVDVADGPTLVAAAYLHDIGYAPELVRTGFHSIDGAQWLRSQGLERVACLVAHHSGACFEASARGVGDDLASFPEERSPVADALTFCDLTTGPQGERISVTSRLQDIEDRYGADSAVAQGISAATDTLQAAVARTEARLSQADAVV